MNSLPGVAIFRPLNIHRATVVFLNLYGLFCQFLHFFVGQREDVTLFLAVCLSILTCLPCSWVGV